MLVAMRWRDRLKAAGVHFGICLAVAVLSALLVFGLWFPFPYREMSGGRELFLIVVSVDMVLGPLITLVIFNSGKQWVVLRRDLAVIVLLQLAALGYGLWTVFIARPVHLVFEYDRLRVVHAVEVPAELLGQAPDGVRAMPWFGPTPLSLRPFKNAQEQFQSTMAALQGIPLSARPDLWQAYEAARPAILQAAGPMTKLKRRFPDRTSEIDQAVQATGRPAKDLLYLPMVGRKTFWTALLDANTAQPLAFLPLDSF